jgi:hypothetical protein
LEERADADRRWRERLEVAIHFDKPAAADFAPIPSCIDQGIAARL